MRKAQSIVFILAVLGLLTALVGTASGAVVAAPLLAITDTPTATFTNTPTPSDTPTNTPTGTLSSTPTPTATPTVTGTPPTATPTRQIVLGSPTPTPIQTPLLPEAGSIDAGEASFGSQGVLVIGALLLTIGFIWMAIGRRRAA